MGLTVTLVFFAVLEGILRLALGPPPPTVQVYAALSDHERYLLVEGDTVTPDYSIPPVPSFARTTTAPRIVALGGSSVHGGTHTLQVDREFPHRAGAMLGVEAVNLGSPGLDSHDHVRIVDELDPIDLSALVVYAGHNDFGNAHFESRYGTVSSALVARTRSMLGRLQTYAQLARLATPITGARRRTKTDMLPGAGTMSPMSEGRMRMAFSGYRANLDRIAWKTKRRGVPLVLVTPVGLLTQPSDRAPCHNNDNCPQTRIAKAAEVANTDPEAAVAILEQVRDSDPMGLRAPTYAVQAVREVAGAWSHVTLVDAEARLPRDRTFDVPSRRLFIDVVHLSPQGHNQMAALVAIALEPVLGVTATLPADGERLRSGAPPRL